MYNNAIKGQGAFGAGGSEGATRYWTCGPTGAKYMTVFARALSYHAVPQRIGYSGS